MKRTKPTCTLLVAILILGVATASVGAETQPKLFVDPPTYTATILDEVFTIDINISNIQNLGSFEFKLGYNTTLLDILDAVEGPFPPASTFTAEIYEPEGYVWVYGVCEPATGNGTMAIITFKATHAASASCALDLFDTALYDASGPAIDHDVEDGNYRFAILDITVATDKPYYYQEENVTIHGNLTLDGSPHHGLVALQVTDPTDPTGYPIVARTVETGPTPPPEEITILEVHTCDMIGNPKETFTRGATLYVMATVKNIHPTETKTVAIVANGYDANGVPFSPVPYTGPWTLGPDLTATLGPAPMYIPTSASVGNGTVYASALTDWPRNGGTPYCPEKSATFQINESGQGPGAPGSGTDGNYSLTFKLSNTTKAGIYRVYATSSYKWQSTASSTKFGVDAIYVPDHYPTIQGAVDAAIPTNNSILVLSGTYDGPVTINKANLTLVGIDPTNTVIDGGGTGTVVTVAADKVKIYQFTIKNSGASFPYSGIALTNSSNCTISENIILDNYNGIYLNSSSDENTIQGNTITSNNGYGINIHSSNNNDILDNTLSSNNHGIYLNCSSQGNTIQGNTITSNNGYGINIHSSNNNDILDNTLSSNNYGVYLNYSIWTTLRDNNMIGNRYNFGVFGDSISDFFQDIDESNTVDGKPVIYWINRHNTEVPSNAGFVAILSSTNIAVRGLDLTKNGQGVLFASTTDSLIERVNTTNCEYGIYLFDSDNNTFIGGVVSNNSVGIYQRYSNENLIFHNNFTNNADQVLSEESVNTWDNGYPSGGNYWSDYTGVDMKSGPYQNETGSDGIGDTPYNVTDTDNQDRYPLMNWRLVHDVAITSVTPIIPNDAPHVYPGWVIKVTVTVKNKGDFTETFNIIGKYNGNLMDTKNIPELTPLAETAINLTWDTTYFSNGTYEIKAETSEIYGETYTFTDGMVKVNKLGDVNSDDKIDIGDVGIVKRVYSGYLLEYYVRADLNADGKVDIGDVGIVKRAYSGYMDTLYHIDP